MSWSRPVDLKAQLNRLWERGELLRDLVTGRERFPLRLSLKTPASTDITERFDSVRLWAEELAKEAALRIEWQVIRHRVQGRQNLPAAVWVDSRDAALAWLGRRREAEDFSALVEQTRQSQPALLPWLEKRPLAALELLSDWPRLLSVVAWLQRHPRPAIYLRQVDLPGVHSKFIEAHRGVLAELLDLVLEPDEIDPARSGAGQFAARYGFREKPLRIRFRVLDPELPPIPGLPCPDLTLDAASFSRLALPVRRVFITENEVNFLAFPPVSASVVIFGAGYGWEALAPSRWLADCALHYWGDIDTHGFAILDQLRSHFPTVESLLMDRETLEAHERFWGTEEKPRRDELTRLRPKERELYDALRNNRLRDNLRLEQEHIGYRWLEASLAGLRPES